MVNLYLSVHVEEPLVVVHPDFRHARRVDSVRVLGDEVGVPRTENVADVRAGHVLHAAAASPRAEGEFCGRSDSMLPCDIVFSFVFFCCYFHSIIDVVGTFNIFVCLHKLKS